MLLTERAAAKVNLTLHITGQRSDGYHLLDSLVVFADVGDILTFAQGDPLSLKVDGPEADGVPTDHSNSVLKIAQAVLPDAAQGTFHLSKYLPTEAGIGGGTADAAAAFRAIARTWPEQFAPPHAQLESDPSAFVARCEALSAIGADIPVCLLSQTARMSGIGEQVALWPGVPTLHAVLVNPRVAVPTPTIFAGITTKQNPPMPDMPQFDSYAACIAWLKEQRNDMQIAACTAAPIINDVLAGIAAQPGCDLARMSGSGATCFGLFETARAAQDAADAIQAQAPHWWVHVCRLGDDAVS